jgi:hypothetical protein
MESVRRPAPMPSGSAWGVAGTGMSGSLLRWRRRLRGIGARLADDKGEGGMRSSGRRTPLFGFNRQRFLEALKPYPVLFPENS